jgi:AbiV family abortive infection protein
MKRALARTPTSRSAQDEILLNKLAYAALENAEALLSDSRTLQQKESFGPAFALAVLAEEELGKANNLWLAGLDKTAKLTTDGKLALGGRTYEPFRSHALKQTVQLAPPFLLSIFDPVFEQVTRLNEKGPLDEKAVVAKIDEYIAELSKDQTRFLQAVKPIIELGGLEREKQNGLYVGYQKGTIVKPSDFPRERCQEVIDRVAEEIGSTREHLQVGLTREIETLFTMFHILSKRVDLTAFAKKLKRGLPQAQLEKEMRKMRRELTFVLRQHIRS